MDAGCGSWARAGPETLRRTPPRSRWSREYAAWYDRHLDPAWGRRCCWRPADGGGKRLPWAYVVPKGVPDLIGMGRSFAKTTFLSAGNITHTPAYGNLIALGVLSAVQSRNVSQQHVAEAVASCPSPVHDHGSADAAGGAS